MWFAANCPASPSSVLAELDEGMTRGTMGFLVSFREESMRKWCAIVAMGVLIALPICAQQKDTGTTTSSNTSESTNAVPAADFSIAHASANLFGMPAAAAKPADVFSDWSNNPWNRHAWGQL